MNKPQELIDAINMVRKHLKQRENYHKEQLKQEAPKHLHFHQHIDYHASHSQYAIEAENYLFMIMLELRQAGDLTHDRTKATD